MTDLGPHAAFIVSAYLGVSIAVAALIVHRLVDARRVASRLTVLETDIAARRPEPLR